MKAIILAAGSSESLGPGFDGVPKCLIDLAGNSLLEIELNTLHRCGIEDVVVVCGYEKAQIQIPGIRYYDNDAYETTGTLESLFTVEKELQGDVLVLYADIVFEEEVLRRLLESSHDVSLGVLVNWEEAKRHRRNWDAADLEMVLLDAGNQVRRIGKIDIQERHTLGQFTGMMKLSAGGSEMLKRHFRRASQLHQAGLLEWARDLRKAWMTELLQEMATLGVPVHGVIIEKGWLEIDTPEDYDRAVEDTEFVHRLVSVKTDWEVRAAVYDNLDWVNNDKLLSKMLAVTGPVGGNRVLDLGTGTGKVLRGLDHVSDGAELYGIDASPAMLECARAQPGGDRVNWLVMDAEKLGGFQDDFFDVVTARMVLHHVADLDRAGAEVHRVLKPGGRFVVCEGNPPAASAVEFYTEMFRFKEERRTFLESDLINFLVASGFTDVCTHTLTLERQSLNNWLGNSGLPARNVEIIRKRHHDVSPHVKALYDMEFEGNDILMTWKFSILTGIKPV